MNRKETQKFLRFLANFAVNRKNLWQIIRKIELTNFSNFLLELVKVNAIKLLILN